MAVNVFDPDVRPVTTNVLVTTVGVLPCRVIEFASEAATPVAVSDIHASFGDPLAVTVALRVTIAMPEAGMVTVVDGPAPAARSV